MAYHGVALVTSEEFSQGFCVTVKKSVTVTSEVLYGRLEKLKAGSPSYSIFCNNCEHVASYLVCGFKESRQLRGTAIGAAGGLTIAVARDENILPWMVGGALLGLLFSK